MEGCSAVTARPKAAGFTLTEILVVAGVIAALAGLMSIAVVRGLFSARSASCSSNLHQIGLAVDLYAADHEELWPPPAFVTFAFDSRAGARLFKAAVRPYGKEDGSFFCPLDPYARRNVSDNPLLHASTETSYGENVVMLFHGQKLSDDILSFRFSPTSITNPAGCASITDVAYKANPLDTSAKLVTSHIDRFNSLFLDGHVKNYAIYEGANVSEAGKCEGPLPKPGSPR